MLQPKLTPKQQAFVEEYLKDLNATQAAIRAGYSEKTAYRTGSENVRKPQIAQAIAEAKAARSKRTQIDADWLLQRLAAEAEADVLDIIGENGEILPVCNWPKIWRQGLVAGIDVEEIRDYEGNHLGNMHKVRLSDRVRRLELIGKHVDVGAFRDDAPKEAPTINLVINRPGGA